MNALRLPTSKPSRPHFAALALASSIILTAGWRVAAIPLSPPPASGTVIAWGDNSRGQTSVPKGLADVVAIAAGSLQSLALKRDGTVAVWGYAGEISVAGPGKVPAGLTGVAAIAAGSSHNLALKRDGTVVAWGLNDFGQMNVPSGLTGVVAIAAGANHSLALKSDGTVIAWGWDASGQTRVPAGLNEVVAVSASIEHSLALRRDGRVVAWGLGLGVTLTPGGLTDVTAIAAGWGHSLALKRDGTVVAWGWNDVGQTSVPAGLQNVVAIAAGGHSLALKADGTVVAWGDNRWGQGRVPAGLGNVIRIAAGSTHNLALISPPRPPTITAIPDQTTSRNQNLGPISFTVADVDTSLSALRATGRSSNQALVPDANIFFGGSGAARTLTIIPANNQTGQTTITVTVSDGPNNTSTSFVMTVTASSAPPTIGSQPLAQTVTLGDEANFGVAASGTAPLSYQWFRDGQPIAGATQPFLTLPKVTAKEAGNYSVVVSNAGGSVTSSMAPLAVPNPLAETVVIATLAGLGAPGFKDGPRRETQFNAPNDAVVAADGSLYVADALNHRIRRLGVEGEVGTLAGTGLAGYSDGPASTAQFNVPLGLFLDRAGDILVADAQNHRVRKVSLAGSRTISTVAGSGQPGYLSGPALSARFNFPNDLVMDAAGNIFVSEFNNHSVRKIAPSGEVSFFAGNGVAGYADGIGTNARFNQPAGLAIDRDENLYVSEWGNQRLRKITPQGVVSTLAGNGEAGFVDGQGVFARFNQPDDLAVDAEGNLFVVEHGNHAVRKVSREGKVNTVAGTGQAGYADALGREAKFSLPSGLALEPSGDLIVSDTGNHSIRKITIRKFPKIVSQPQSQTAQPGETVRLTVSATGYQPIRFQWRHNRAEINGATNATLVVSEVRAADAGGYTVLVSNAAGTISSDIAEVTVSPPSDVVIRKLPANYAPGVKFMLVLLARPAADTTVYAVEDTPPAGWTVGQINESGLFDSANRKVKFGPFFDANIRSLSYDVTPPTGETGRKEFKGIVSVNGEVNVIGGPNAIEWAPPFHPADNNPADNRISINEVTAYGAAWRRGSTWPNPPNPIPIDYVTRAGTLWKGGEDYTIDPSVPIPPLWWVSRPAVGLRSLRATSQFALTAVESTVVAVQPDRFVPGEPFPVRISVKPATSVQAFAVQDEIPVGWTVTNVSHNGEFDAVNRQVKWGPFFDNQSRELGFQTMSGRDAQNEAPSWASPPSMATAFRWRGYGEFARLFAWRLGIAPPTGS